MSVAWLGRVESSALASAARLPAKRPIAAPYALVCFCVGKRLGKDVSAFFCLGNRCFWHDPFQGTWLSNSIGYQEGGWPAQFFFGERRFGFYAIWVRVSEIGKRIWSDRAYKFHRHRLTSVRICEKSPVVVFQNRTHRKNGFNRDVIAGLPSEKRDTLRCSPLGGKYCCEVTCTQTGELGLLALNLGRCSCTVHWSCTPSTV